MALTVTPGGAADDSLLSLAGFATFCAAFGHDVSAYSDAQKEVALRKATLWVEGLGTRGFTRSWRWPGVRAAATQAREWPRSSAPRPDGTALDSATIPAEIENAVGEAAVYELGNAGALFGVLSPSSIVSSEQVGPIKVTYAVPANFTDARDVLAFVNDMLSSVLLPEIIGQQSVMRAVGRGDTTWT